MPKKEGFTDEKKTHPRDMDNTKAQPIDPEVCSRWHYQLQHWNILSLY